MIRRWASLLTIFGAPLVLASAPSSCGYDWTVRDSPQARFDGAVADTGAEEDAGEREDAGEEDASVDAGLDANPCAQLRNDLATARDTAQTCVQGSVPTPCTTSVLDECGCRRFVREPDSGVTKDFEAAVAKFKVAKCSPACSTCNISLSGTCLLPTNRCFP